LPDNAIVKNNKIVALVDLKMDMGYNRNGLVNLCVEKNARLQHLRGKLGKINKGKSKDESEVVFSENLISFIAIITNKNSGKKLDEYLNSVSIYEPDVCTYVLTRGLHPNSYKMTEEANFKGLKIERDAFKLILEKLRQFD